MPKYTNAELLTDGKGNPMPQYLDVTDTTASPEGTFKPLGEKSKVELTGSLTKKIVEHNEIAVFESINYAYIGSGGFGGGISSSTTVDVSEHGIRTFYVKNNYSNALSVNMALIDDGQQVIKSTKISLPAGATKFFTESDFSLLNKKVGNLSVLLEDGTVETGKSVKVVMFGGN